jgi:hypothetical protein
MVSRTSPLVLLLACGGPTEQAPQLDTHDWVVRASLDLRGVRPSLDEIRSVAGDTEAAEALVASFVDDERFAGRVADLYAELYLTRTETWPLYPEAYGLADRISTPSYVQSIGEEPLAILERIVDEDLPWTEVVLGDWTMANGVLEQIWPVQREDGEGDWRVAHYTDGRPAAGVLSTNAMWWRYGSTPSNANRGRAAQVTRLFLCVDYSEVAIPFDADIDLLDEAAVAEAIRTDKRCASCHDTLDPIAGYLYGFWYVDPQSPIDASSYHPERELLFDDFSQLAPAVDRDEGYSLRDLGRQLASDQRFPDCAVEQWWRMLMRRAPASDEADLATLVRNDFIEGDLTIRALARSLVTSEAYRASAAAANGRKLASPELLASQIEDLTGYRWVDQEGWDVVTADLAGLRSLAGGADGVFSTRNADLPNATTVLVQERLAEAGAAWVVANDIEAGRANARLFTRVDLEAAPEAAGADMAAQLVDLHARLFGTEVAADGPEVTANLELWNALYELEGSPARAWFGVLSALLRDPDLLLY